MKTYSGLICLLIALLLMCGCSSVAVNSKELHRLDKVHALSKSARIGITEFTVCGGSYTEKLKPEYLDQDSKAVFFRKCTDLGHPKTFYTRLRHRLEEKLGRKLVQVTSEKSYKPKQVYHDAEKLGLEYVIAGDLLYLGEKDNATVVSALFYLVRVADGKIVVVGRVKNDGSIGTVLKVIDNVADELYAKIYED